MKNKTLIIALPLCLTVMSGQAATLSSAVQACSQEQDSLKRLVCYDKVAKELRQYSDLDKPSSPQPIVNAQPAVSKAQPQMSSPKHHAQPEATMSNVEKNFGMEEKISREESADKILVTLQDKDRDNYGKWVLTMTNGQVWKQADTGRFPLPDGQLYIERGMLGSFFLSSESVNRKIRVKRIK
ncbi:hypothetical protein KJY73_11250 [Bowmanella sp. Y26]|uniref:hypothetical protein n=1 Tax=Bowmanella yangjiangensis TaxID=2811230 RepID=UPI001BDBCF20|nr:hypothetical protein [Bowmanella yangjiangensis]MBT1064155.1 hypothetical protein [Bowmanella yangjiangensis]